MAAVRAAFGGYARMRTMVVEGAGRRVPTLQSILVAIPVKSLSILNFLGVLSVIFATTGTIDARSFGGCCGAAACLCLTLASRVPRDDEVLETFSPIMSGTPRQKARSLQTSLRTAGFGFALIGAGCAAASRVADAQLSDAPARAVGAEDALALLAVAILSLQVVAASPHDDADPFHAALDTIALDATALAQAAAVAGLGAPVLATGLVAWALALLWGANTAQLAEPRAGGGESGPGEPTGFAV